MSAFSRFFAAAFVVFVVGATALAEPSTQPPTPQPALIVWAHTDMPSQGAPTLDIVDLERYFVAALNDRSIAKVSPSATARLPRPPAPNAYLAELTVDAMQLVERPVWNKQFERYQADTMFCVELSARVRHLASGKLLGIVRSRAEHHFRPMWDSRDTTEKRVAIYEAAQNLADAFVNESSGRSGLAVFQPPPLFSWTPLSHVRLDDVLFVVAFVITVGALGVLGCLLVTAISRSNRRYAEKEAQRRDDEKLDAAFTLAISTKNFSDAACRKTAEEGLEELLERREAIEEAEARRIAHSKDHEKEYARLAASGATRCDYDEDTIAQILRKAGEWDYRVLREALAQEEEEEVAS